MASTRITWQDTLEAPEDGQRYEAIGGKLYVTPTPSILHQRVSGNLFEALRRALHHSGIGMVLHAPVGVEFPDTEEGVQPDILFVSNDRLHIVGPDWIRGAPDLVVEIVSPGTATRDRRLKRDLYERHGVAEYWIVDPHARSVDVWRFAAGAARPDTCRARVPVRWQNREITAIELSEIFSPAT